MGETCLFALKVRHQRKITEWIFQEPSESEYRKGQKRSFVSLEGVARYIINSLKNKNMIYFGVLANSKFLFLDNSQYTCAPKIFMFISRTIGVRLNYLFPCF
nr:hypothetical protein BCV09_16305 [Vibrio cyclitrophicus]